MNPLARINHLNLDDTRLSAAQTLNGVYAEPSVAGELRVYEIRRWAMIEKLVTSDS